MRPENAKEVQCECLEVKQHRQSREGSTNNEQEHMNYLRTYQARYIKTNSTRLGTFIRVWSKYLARWSKIIVAIKRKILEGFVQLVIKVLNITFWIFVI